MLHCATTQMEVRVCQTSAQLHNAGLHAQPLYSLVCVCVCVQVESLNLLSDSNRLLRDERDRQLLQLRELEERCRQLEGEMGPLRENNKSLTAQKDALLAEKTALRYTCAHS